MANPNLVTVTDIRAKTAVQSISTATTTIISNSAASNKVFKVNTLVVSNIDGTNIADVTVNFVRSAANYALASTVSVPADATLVVISKENFIYLEEGDSISLAASANSDLQAVCSYEEIS